MSISRRKLFQTSLIGGAASLMGAKSALGAEQAQPAKVKGVVFMVSDGMSQGVLSMTEAFSQQIRDKGTTWWGALSDQKATHGLMDTASASSLVTDSAAASSAWSTGRRVPNGQIAIDANGKKLETIGETLVGAGAKLGLVTTVTVTNATPAGFAAHTPKRQDEASIAPQYLNRADIILGGGADHFDKKTRKDKRDLFSEYQKSGYEVLRSRKDLLKSKSQRILGTFSPRNFPYCIDRNQSDKDQEVIPTLAEMSEAALSRFLAGEESFLLQIEGAKIDKAAHKNDIGALLHEQLAFDDAVAKVLSMLAARDDVLVVITSDHGNSNPGLRGLGARYAQTDDHFEKIALLNASQEKVIGSLMSGRRKVTGSVKDFTRLSKAHFGFEPTQQEAEAILDVISNKNIAEWDDQQRNPWGILGQIVGNHTGVGWTGVTHTSDPTQITAIGPGAEQFFGLIRNDSVRDKLLGLLIG